MSSDDKKRNQDIFKVAFADLAQQQDRDIAVSPEDANGIVAAGERSFGVTIMRVSADSEGSG